MTHSLAEKRVDFSDDVKYEATFAPDEYHSHIVELHGGKLEFAYAKGKSILFEDWAAVRAGIKRDLDKAEIIDAKLKQAFTLLDAGEKEAGRELLWEIYRMDLKKLR